jgi:aminoglycoside phosphotransferase (APT) family kinase protein
MGGYTQAERWLVRTADGRSAFVKAAVDTDTAAWLRAEHRIYANVTGSFLPKLITWIDDEDRPVLVLDDLSEAFWPPPWTREQVSRVLETLREVATTAPPPGLDSLASFRNYLTSWPVVAKDPSPFLSLGLCSEGWLEQALPDLIGAERAFVLTGDALVHFDVRSDNICFANERTLLVDWNGAVVGNPVIDVAAWLPSLHAEGGPAPEELLPNAPEAASLVSGFFAARAGLPPIENAPRVREVQLAQLRTALPWAARALDLPTPA